LQSLEGRLTIRHLRLVDAIAQEGNLVRAAQRLNMTQSAVTKALQEVEVLIGVALFKRTNRGTVPTSYGENLASHARIVISQLRHAGRDLADLRDGLGGRVAIGTLLSATVSLLPLAITKVLEARPNIKVKIVEGTNDTLMPLLRIGELDFVIGRLPEYRERTGILQEILTDDNAQVVVREGHPLIGRASLSLRELVQWSWIMPREETTLRRQLDEAFRREGVEPPRCSVESVSILANRALLLATDYLAVWPAELAVAEERYGIVSLPIALPTTHRPIGISTRAQAGLSPAAEALVQTLRAVAKNRCG